MQFVFFALAVAAGLSNPVQSAVNAALNKGTGQPLAAAFIIYSVALSALVLCALAYGLANRGLGAKVPEVPWWAYAGGLCNLLFVVASAIVTREIGSGAYTVTVAGAAVTLSVVLDKFGLLGLEVHEASWQRVVGAGLAIAGIALVSIY